MRCFHRAALLLCTLHPLLSASLAAAEPPPLLWADFKDDQRTPAGAPVQPLAASERPGDAAVGALRLVGSAIQVEGKVSQSNGSQWATLGVEVVGEPGRRPVDLSRYQSIGIRLASAVPRVLRVRLKGPDMATLNAGCYPVVMQRVGPQATHYVIPLSAFGPEAYCGPKGASAAQTLPAVTAVEITVNEPSPEPVEFSVGRIEFMPAESAVAAAADGTGVLPDKLPPDTRSAAGRAQRGSTTATSTPQKEPQRKRPAASDSVQAQPVRQVTCERNARYGLVMCY